MQQRVKLGIVGCGFAGTQTMYAPILRLLEHGEVTALMDPDRNALTYMTTHYGQFETYNDYDAFLSDANIDAVLVASPVFLHESQVIAAAQAGKHILCEKPMAPTIEACQQMIDACERNGVVLMVGFVRRFDKSLQLAHQMIAEGKIGQLFHIRAEVSWCHDNSPLGANWRQSIRTLGGIFQDNASHIVDLCEWWAGPVDTVSADVAILRPDWEVETHAHATLRHRGGVISTIHASNNSHKPMLEAFLLEGTQGALEIQFGPAAKYSSSEPFQMYLWECGATRTELTRFNRNNLDEELREHNMYKQQVDHFCECALEGKSSQTDGMAGYRATEIVNAAYLSSASQTRIRLPLEQSGDLEALFSAMKTVEDRN